MKNTHENWSEVYFLMHAQSLIYLILSFHFEVSSSHKRTVFDRQILGEGGGPEAPSTPHELCPSRTTSLTLFWYVYCQLWIYFTYVSFVYFEQINICWVNCTFWQVHLLHFIKTTSSVFWSYPAHFNLSSKFGSIFILIFPIFIHLFWLKNSCL